MRAGRDVRYCTPERDRRDAVDARRLEARCPCCGGRAACRLRPCRLARAGCGRAVVLVRAGSCGLRAALHRSPDETYRLHHNIKASEHRVIGKPESKLSPQANTAGERVDGRGGAARCGGPAMRHARGRTAARRDELAMRRARRAGDAAGRRPAPARLGGSARPGRCTVCVRRRWDARFGGLAARVRPWDAPVFHSESIFGAPISSFAMLMPCLPIFWALCGANEPDAMPSKCLAPHLLGPFAEKRPRI